MLLMSEMMIVLLKTQPEHRNKTKKYLFFNKACDGDYGHSLLLAAVDNF